MTIPNTRSLDPGTADWFIDFLGLPWFRAQVVNTHILCDPAAADVKLFQAHLLVKARL